MQKKPPDIELSPIIAGDLQWKYGARLPFQVLGFEYLGNLIHVALLLPCEAIVTSRPSRTLAWEAGVCCERQPVDLITAAAVVAQVAGIQAAHGVLLVAISYNFVVRLSYQNHELVPVFARTDSPSPSTLPDSFLTSRNILSGRNLWTASFMKWATVGFAFHGGISRGKSGIEYPRQVFHHNFSAGATCQAIVALGRPVCICRPIMRPMGW